MRAALLVLLALVCLLVGVSIGVPMMAARAYGAPSPHLGPVQLWQYSAGLLWADGLLTTPRDVAAPEVDFEVGQGESINAICDGLVQAGLIREAWMMRDYLIYTGLDTSLQAGTYRLRGSMSVIEIARQMQDATPADVKFVILPGWRMEEIAASLPTSGLSITPEEFIAAASSARTGYAFLAGASTSEGFLYPDSYVLLRNSTPNDLVEAFVRDFSLHLSTDLQEGFARQGLDVQQAVILASIVQREAIKAEEAPLIASVYLNRLRAQMRLDADPTVQYALGYNASQGTWWTNPLSLDDLKVDSPYNTYATDGLPPAPIANPGMGALEAVASPAETSYYYFSARCDESGYHQFAETFEAHLKNLCP